MKTIAACLASAFLGALGVAAFSIGSAAGPPVQHFRPTHSLVVDGYGYSCQTTARTPNFACWYGSPNGPTRTPIMTVFKGSRTMRVESALRPVTKRDSTGSFETTFRR